MMQGLTDYQSSLFLNASSQGIVMTESKDGVFPSFKMNPNVFWLKDIADVLGLSAIERNVDQAVASLVWDSRQVVKGSVFFAIKGEQVDGNDYIPQAIERGAIAIVSEEPYKSRNNVVCFEVADVREGLANCARRFYNNPDEELHLIGITGTNGKTTVSRLTKQLLDAEGSLCGLIGTIDYVVGDRVLPSNKTTPEADEISSLLSEMKANGCERAVMEVSSHGIDQKRTHALNFDTVAFLNLTQDHLDYHKDIERYFEVKTRLFRGVANPLPKNAVLNMDDLRIAEFAKQLNGDIRQITFSVGCNEADFTAHNIELLSDGIQFELSTPEGDWELSAPLLGSFNATNLVAAIACAYAAGASVKTLIRKVSDLESVPGRMEMVAEGQGFLTVVDYAHSPDALDKLLESVSALENGRLITVFGCGGDRDREKRPLMTQVACKHSDLVIATSDNPRTEAQSDIFDDMIKGMDGKTRVKWISDREEAIRMAIADANTGDAVVIAGKGHENFQLIDHAMIPFNDRLVARAALAVSQDTQSQLFKQD